MAKRLEPAAFTVVSVDHTASVPLFRQLYEGMRTVILAGQLAAGVRVPSTRSLAHELGVSRHTVLIAFAQLLAEGYLEGKRGAGTYVAQVRSADAPGQATFDASAPPPTDRAVPALALRGRAFAAAPSEPPRWDRPPAFRIGSPALDVFPYRLWSRLLARHWRRSARHLLGYDDSAGYRPLREAIAAYLGTSRGVRCTPDQVIVVAGARQALTLAAQLLLDPGDAAWVADPGPLGVRAALRGAGARLAPVPVDEEGLDVAAGKARRADARLVYVSPSHLFPLGATMSVRRRTELLEWARWSGAWVLEADYYSEYRYGGRPLAALHVLDSTNQVIYLGTFSRLLFPTLRLGYMVVPPDLVEAFVAARRATDLYSPALEQAVLADFIGAGYLAHHVRQMREVYAERQAVLITAASRDLPGALDVRRAGAGMHLVGWLPQGVDDRGVARRAAALGVETSPLSAYGIDRLRRDALLLGYTGPNVDEIRAGVRQLALALGA